MSHVERQLQHARPSLRVVSPLAYWIVAVMAVFNLLLGTSFFYAIDQVRFTAPLLIVNDLLTFDFWGVVFIGIGLIKLYAILSNNWNLARNSLFIGVSIKAAWMVAFIIRTFVSPGTFFLMLCWVTIAIIQMGCYIWFMPPAVGTYKQQREQYE